MSTFSSDIGPEEEDGAGCKAMAIAAALMAGLDGRAAIDRAMESA